MSDTKSDNKASAPKNDQVISYDQSRRAQQVLDYVLHEDADGLDPDAMSDPANAPMDVAAARSAQPIVQQASSRTASRALFITSDIAVLTTGSTLQNEYIARASVFDEVHVLVLIPRKGTSSHTRIGDRTWVYSIYSPHWWMLPFTARSAAKELLTFNNSIRPDLIVAAEPYEAGVAALLISRAFDRPVQVHVPEDFMAETYLDRTPHNKWRRRMAKYVLKRVQSARAKTDAIKAMLADRFKKLNDLEVLPRFYNFTGYLQATPTSDIHDTYRDFVFITIAFGPLTADSHLHEMITALNRPLHNPRIGLVIVGEGPAEELFREKVRILGIDRSVVFVRSLEDPISSVKTADLLFSTGTDRASEEHVMRAAAAGIPIIAAETDLLNDLFDDGSSAFLCTPYDTQCMTQKFTKLLNSPALRKQFARNGEQIARDRLIEDPNAYYRSLRDSIEVVLGGEEEK